MFDDSIITDTFQEKKQDPAEVGATMTVAEFREKWYEDYSEALCDAPALLGTSGKLRHCLNCGIIRIAPISE